MGDMGSTVLYVASTDASDSSVYPVQGVISNGRGFLASVGPTVTMGVTGSSPVSGSTVWSSVDSCDILTSSVTGWTNVSGTLQIITSTGVLLSKVSTFYASGYAFIQQYTCPFPVHLEKGDYVTYVSSGAASSVTWSLGVFQT
jgi:hypothetical protein